MTAFLTERTAAQSTTIRPRSLFSWLTTAEMEDVLSRSFSIDLTTKIQAAFDSGEAIFVPNGLYRHDAMLTIPNNVMFSMHGLGFGAEFRAGAAMDYQVYKDGLDVEGATKDPVFIRGIMFNANRLANVCVRVGASKGGHVTDVKVHKFLVDGARFGDDSASLEARYYENTIKIVADGDINQSASTATMPTNGVVLTSNATDNVLAEVVGSYITEAAVDVSGGGNHVLSPHAYGSNTNDTGPKYCVRMRSRGRISDPYADNVTVAGVKIGGQNISLVGGDYYWAADNTPANAPTTAPVPIEVDSGVDTISIIGGTARGDNSANPFIRWLGTRTQRASVWGQSPPRRYAGDKGINTVERSIGITRTPSNDSALIVDATATYKAQVSLQVGGNERYRMQTDGVAESGSEAGSNFVINYYTDAAVETAALTHTRSTGLWSIKGRVMVADTHLGFYGTTPIAKQTGVSVTAEGIHAALVALGLIAA